MNKREFYDYLCENYSIGGTPARLILNILNYIDNNIQGENEQYLALCELLDGTIGLSDKELRKVYF